MIHAGTLQDSRPSFVGEERVLVPFGHFGGARAAGAPVADDGRKAYRRTRRLVVLPGLGPLAKHRHQGRPHRRKADLHDFCLCRPGQDGGL